MPTSVWSKKSVVEIHKIYTRLSWVKEEHTPAGTTKSELSKLKHYNDLFAATKNGVIPKRILVQGEVAIGKSTFVKKLLVDWVEVDQNTVDEQAAALKKFGLVLAVNLKEVGTFSIRFFVGNGKPQTAKCHVTMALRSRLQFAVHV